MLGAGSSASLPSAAASSFCALRARLLGFPGPDVLALLDMTMLGAEATESRGRLETETRKSGQVALLLSQQAKGENSCPECKPATPTTEHRAVTLVGNCMMKASRVSKQGLTKVIAKPDQDGTRKLHSPWLGSLAVPGTNCTKTRQLCCQSTRQDVTHARGRHPSLYFRRRIRAHCLRRNLA